MSVSSLPGQPIIKLGVAFEIGAHHAISFDECRFKGLENG